MIAFDSDDFFRFLCPIYPLILSIVSYLIQAYLPIHNYHDFLCFLAPHEPDTRFIRRRVVFLGILHSLQHPLDHLPVYDHRINIVVEYYRVSQDNWRDHARLRCFDCNSGI